MTTETGEGLDLNVKQTPTGSTLTCKGWVQEAALRMLLNNLDPEVAERPEDLIVYGGRGKAARNKEALVLIIKALKDLEDNETLLIQSGKPVGILPTHKDAPRVLISNSQLVPKWATQQHFDELEDKGLMMYGQMTAGSWIYIGSQGIVQGTYETYAALAKKHFDGHLRGTLNVTAGLGGMGGAQPLAITMNEGVCLAADVEEWRIKKRLETRYIDEIAYSIDEAIDLALQYKNEQKAVSIGVVANAVELLQRLIERNITPDTLTDQTSAHDPLIGYFPEGFTVEEANKLRTTDPKEYVKRSYATMAKHVQLMLELQKRGAITFDYGNNLRGRALEAGVTNAFDFPGFVPAYIRPLFCEGKGPFRWAALSGDPVDIYETDRLILELFPENESLRRWITMAQERIAFQGLPARICWLGQGEREKAGLAFNQLVADGRVKAPIVIGRDHLDTGSVASPNRETEAMLDGSDAVADWPVLNALINTAGGASWVSLHHGGGVGIGYSIHAGMVIVADGTADAAARIKRVLHNDPAMGVIRHADAGYDIAKDTLRKHRLGPKVVSRIVVQVRNLKSYLMSDISIKQLLLVGLGGGIGSILRYLTSLATPKYAGNTFPLATFITNVLGCLLIGLLAGYFLKNGENQNLKLLFITGFCGGYTTFSTFAAENITLFQQQNYGVLIGYMLSSLIFGFAAVAIGLTIMK